MRKKLPIEWILAFALTPVVILVFLAWIVFGASGRQATPETHADVKKVVRIYPSLKPEYNQAMADGSLSLSEANSILKKANALTAKSGR
jgi:hypothetical protein